VKNLFGLPISPAIENDAANSYGFVAFEQQLCNLENFFENF
jgi:hypothetical protein